ncbi:MAG: 50S ribosomal protein L25/general stress protein Ctc [Paludibacteraceae bacterium]|nr:50S ribosomal protein L25/general stress protein Ctc [Paludibacteraceae bacterium]MBQ4391417.1 50S ribosomal protein L25/general stress protein Ctc [Paludibacteraceae bacterium]
MKTFELVGTPRSEYGKKAAKGLRKEELVPCNIYGLGDNITFTVAEADVRKLIYTPDTLAVALTIGDVKKMAVVKELQFHPISGRVLHIDFLEVNEKKPVTVAVPVQLEGHAEGVKAGGKLSLEMRKLKVNGIYTQIPDRIVVDVTELGLGKKLAVEDIKMADGLKLMNVKDACVAQVKATRASATAATEEAAAE